MSNFDPNHILQKNYFLVGQKCIVFNTEGKILLLKRSNKAGGSGEWSLPGGGLEKGEDTVESIKREVDEETQIEIYDIKLVNVITFIEGDDSVLMICYRAKTDSDKITLNWEHDEYKWVTREEVINENLSVTIKEIIKQSSSIVNS